MIKKLKDILGNFIVDPNRVVNIPMPNEMYRFHHGLRQTGRTSRMLVEALGVFLSGKNIDIISANMMQAKMLRDKFVGMLNGAGLINNTSSIRQNTVELILHNGPTRVNFKNRPPNEYEYAGIPVGDLPTIFYDHYFIEKSHVRY